MEKNSLSTIKPNDASVALAVTSVNDLMRLAHLLVASGLYTTITSVEQAAAIILAGSELGLRPCAALSNLNIIKNKITMSANLLAQMLKAHPNYTYRITEHTTEICTVEVLEKFNGAWESLGSSSFTKTDATEAGLTTNPKLENWQKFIKDMLFARAISRAVRQLAPDVAQGLGIYETQEMIDTMIREQKNHRVIERPVEHNGKTEWVEPTFKTLDDALLWGQKVLACTEEEIKTIFDSTEEDATGKKAINFKGTIRTIWDNGGDIPSQYLAEQAKELEIVATED
jgi:hypothetical protein